MSPWQLLRAHQSSRAALGYHLQHGAAGTLHYSMAPAPPAGLCAANESLCPSSEKQTMQQLNMRLASFLQQVEHLEATNQRLENEIQEELRRRCPKNVKELDGLMKSASLLQDQIRDCLSDRAQLNLRLLAAELATVDLNTRSEQERQQRSRVEAELSDLRYLLEVLNVHKLPELQHVLREQMQELQEIQQRHLQDEQALLNQVSGGVAVAMKLAETPELIRQLDMLRQITAESWTEEPIPQAPDVTFDLAESPEVAELQDLMWTSTHLTEELKHLQREFAMLESCGRQQTESTMVELAVLQETADRLCLDLDSALQATAQQAADYQILFDVKSRLEAEIQDYMRLLDSPNQPRASALHFNPKPAASCFTIKHGNATVNTLGGVQRGSRRPNMVQMFSSPAGYNNRPKKTAIISSNSSNQSYSFQAALSRMGWESSCHKNQVQNPTAAQSQATESDKRAQDSLSGPQTSPFIVCDTKPSQTFDPLSKQQKSTLTVEAEQIASHKVINLMQRPDLVTQESPVNSVKPSAADIKQETQTAQTVISSSTGRFYHANNFSLPPDISPESKIRQEVVIDEGKTFPASVTLAENSVELNQLDDKHTRAQDRNVEVIVEAGDALCSTQSSAMTDSIESEPNMADSAQESSENSRSQAESAESVKVELTRVEVLGESSEVKVAGPEADFRTCTVVPDLGLSSSTLQAPQNKDIKVVVSAEIIQTSDQSLVNSDDSLSETVKETPTEENNETLKTILAEDIKTVKKIPAEEIETINIIPGEHDDEAAKKMLEEHNERVEKFPAEYSEIVKTILTEDNVTGKVNLTEENQFVEKTLSEDNDTVQTILIEDNENAKKIPTEDDETVKTTPAVEENKTVRMILAENHDVTVKKILEEDHENVDKIPARDSDAVKKIPAEDCETAKATPAAEDNQTAKMILAENQDETVKKILEEDCENVDKIPARDIETVKMGLARDDDTVQKIPAQENETVEMIPVENRDETVKKIPEQKNYNFEKIPVEIIETVNVIVAEDNENVQKIHAEDNETVQKIHAEDNDTVQKIHGGDNDTLQKIHAEDNETVQKICAGDNETVQKIHAEDNETVQKICAEDNETVRKIRAGDNDTVQKSRAGNNDTVQKSHAEDNKTVQKIRAGDNETVQKIHAQDNETVQKIHAQDNETIQKICAEDNETVRKIHAGDNDTVQKIHAEDNEAVQKICAEDNETVQKIPKGDIKTVNKILVIPAEYNENVEKISAEDIGTVKEIPAEENERIRKIPAEEDSMTVKTITAEEDKETGKKTPGEEDNEAAKRILAENNETIKKSPAEEDNVTVKTILAEDSKTVRILAEDNRETVDSAHQPTLKESKIFSMTSYSGVNLGPKESISLTETNSSPVDAHTGNSKQYVERQGQVEEEETGSDLFVDPSEQCPTVNKEKLLEHENVTVDSDSKENQSTGSDNINVKVQEDMLSDSRDCLTNSAVSNKELVEPSHQHKSKGNSDSGIAPNLSKEDCLHPKIPIVSESQVEKSLSPADALTSRKDPTLFPLDQPPSPKDLEMLLCSNDTENSMNPEEFLQKENDDDDACLTEANAHVKPVEKYILSTRDEGKVVPETEKRRNSAGEDIFKVFEPNKLTPRALMRPVSQKSSVKDSGGGGLSSGGSNVQGVIANKEQQLGFEGLYRRPVGTAGGSLEEYKTKGDITNRASIPAGRILTSRAGDVGGAGPRKGSEEWVLYGSSLRQTNENLAGGSPLSTSQPNRGRFGSGEWIVYGGGVQCKNSLDGVGTSPIEGNDESISKLGTSTPESGRFGRRISGGSEELIVYGGKVGPKGNEGPSQAQSTEHLRTLSPPETGRFDRRSSGGSDEWLVYGGRIGRKSNQALCQTQSAEHLRTLSPPETGKFEKRSSSGSDEWLVYGGRIGRKSNEGLTQTQSAEHLRTLSPPETGKFERRCAASGDEWRVYGERIRPNSYEGLSQTQSTEHLRPLSPPETGRFARRSSSDWIVYGGAGRAAGSDNLGIPEGIDHPTDAMQLSLSPPGSARLGCGSGEWRVYGGSGRLSRPPSSELRVISPPSSYTGRGPRVGSTGSRLSSSGVMKRSSSLGSGGRLNSPVGNQRISGSVDTKPVYSSAGGQRSSSIGPGIASGTSQRAQSPAERSFNVSPRVPGGWLHSAAAAAHRTSSTGSGSKGSTGGSGNDRISGASGGRITGSSGSGRVNSTGGRVITSSDRPIRSTGSGSGSHKERISVCKMAALLMSAAGRERNKDKQKKKQQQQQAKAASPHVQRWLTTGVGVTSGDAENPDDIINL